MRRIITVFITILLSFSLVCPAFAASETFVPSITYKGGPVVEDATLDGQNVEDCLIVTSIAEAENKSTDITQGERDLLLEVYKALRDGRMTLPVNGDYVIRELVDLSFEYDYCRILEEHGDKDQKLKEERVTLSVDFDLGVDKDAEVVVMVYIDGAWKSIESVKNNGDGTVTCVFEDICPVVFLVKQDGKWESVRPSTSSPKTGDMIGRNLGLWIGAMVFSVVGIIALMLIRRKRKH